MKRYQNRTSNTNFNFGCWSHFDPFFHLANDKTRTKAAWDFKRIIMKKYYQNCSQNK